MNHRMKTLLSVSLAALCTTAVGLTASAYELSPEVRNPPAALVEATSIGVLSYTNPAKASEPNKDAILVMSFGTTYTDTRAKTIDAVEAAIQSANPNLPVYEAYTSHIIIDRVMENEGIKKLTPAEAFAQIKADGYNRVAVVSLNVIPGIEYDYNRIATKEFINDFKQITFATPLMYWQGTEEAPDEVVDFVQALSSQFPQIGPQDAVLLLAHGTPHPSNAYYSVIQDRIAQVGLNNVYVYSVEGRPNLEDVLPKLQEKGINHVTLMPIMMVAGDHANNDMAGDEEDSHKSILEAEGITVDVYLHGLGENENIRAMYVERANEAVAALE